MKPEVLSGVRTGNSTPHDRYNVHGIAHARINSKDDIFMQRRLLIDKAHTALDIFRFAHMVLIYLCRSILVDLCRACSDGNSILDNFLNNLKKKI